MNIEIDDFFINPTKFSLATMFVAYEKLIMKCELVWSVAGQKYWIRMPEYWAKGKTKNWYCRWPTKEISNEFQILMLQKIFDSDMLTECEIELIHANGSKKALNKKKS